MSLLEIDAVTKSFGSLVAVRGVSLSVAEGELRAVIGPNGAGKTTFFNLISGFFPPTAGRIVFDGQDVTSRTAQRRVALGMARTFQVTEIFPELTVFENVRMGVEIAAGYRLRPWLGRAAAAEVRGRVDEMLGLTGLAAKTDRLVGELSHGDQRAAEIAMALALKPRLLLLDEPTAGMGDTETEHMVDLVRRLHVDRRLSILFIEHDMSIVFGIAQRITVLDQGRVLAEGTPAEISGNEHVRAAYLGVAA
jgi:branched-chain amino acid transport system ATP-binding protein